MWSSLALAGVRVIRVATVIVLARLLSKEDFGIATYALAICALLEIAEGLGVGSAMVFFPIDHRRSSTAFWIFFSTGLLLAVVCGLGAPLAGVLYRDQRAVPVTMAFVFYFPVMGASLPLDALLRKELAFGKRMVPAMSRALVKAISSIAMAVAGLSYWSLVFSQILGAFAFSIGVWSVVRWRPSWVFDLAEAKSLLRYARSLVAVRAIGSITHQLPQVLLGRILGASALGLFSVTLRLADSLITELMPALSQVLFPAYAQMQGDLGRLRRSTVFTLRFVSALTIPAGVGMVLVAEPLVLATLGSEWSATIPLLRWGAVAALLRTITWHFGEVLKAIGRPEILLWLGLANGALLLPALAAVTLVMRSMVAVMILFTAFAALRLIANLAVARALFGVPLIAVEKALLPTLVATLFMALVVQLTAVPVADSSSALQLVSLALVGAASYVVAIRFLDRDLTLEARRVLRLAVSRSDDTAQA